MTRRAALALAAAALAGCPLPQPLPDYPAGTITPPRILVDGLSVAGEPANARAVVLVPAQCPPGREPQYDLSAKIYHTNTIESVEARWFVNYDASLPALYTPVHAETIPADPDPLVLTRDVPLTGPYLFRPYLWRPPVGTGTQVDPPFDAPGTVRVVELVVSNGFDPADSAPLPRRTPLSDFETQLYRWVFVLVPQTAVACP